MKLIDLSFDSFEADFIQNQKKSCVLIIAKDSPPCKVMLDVLSHICDKRDITLVVLDAGTKTSYKYVEKYSAGMLPTFVFSLGDNILYKNHGTVQKIEIEKSLRKVGFLK